MSNMTTSTIHRTRIQAHISDAIKAIDFSNINVSDLSSDELSDMIEDTDVQLSLSFDSNAEMMSFIDDVSREIELESTLDFTKCENYLDAMLVEFNAYMYELTREVLSDYTQQLMEVASAARDAAADILMIEDEDDLEVTMSNDLYLDHITHTSESIIEVDGEEVWLFTWMEQKTVVAKIGAVYIQISPTSH